METQLVQKERLYEDKIKVGTFLSLYSNCAYMEMLTFFFKPLSSLPLELVLFCHMSQSCHMSCGDDLTPH